MSIIAQLTIFPTDKGASVSPYVAEALDIIDKSGLSYRTGPMGTAIEGEWEAVMQTVTNCFDKMREKSGRIYLTLAIDYRKERTEGLTSKTKSLEKNLGRKLK